MEELILGDVAGPRCLQPWQTLMIDAAGVVQPCAYRGNYNNVVNVEPFGNLNQSSLEEIWNSPIAQNVRSCMAAGDLVGAGCGECLALKQGQPLGLEIAPVILPGTRYAENIKLKKAEIAEGLAAISSKPSVLFYTPSHHCNLRCVHCYQGTSRALSIREAADDQVLALVPYLTDIVAGGGEPLILPFWRRMLEDFDTEHNPHLRFLTTTNATVLRDDVVAGLKRVPRLGIVVSIDGIGETFELIRERAEWPVFEANMYVLRELALEKSAPFALNLSVMKQNIHQLPQLVELAINTSTTINFQPVVAYPIDCSLRCFNEVPDNWLDAFSQAELGLERLVEKLRNAGNSFVDWGSFWSIDSIVTQAQATRDLIPWDLLERPHTRHTLTVPNDKWPTVDFLRTYSVDQNWPRTTACVVLAEIGSNEPHWYAPINEDYSYAVSLPKGEFIAWLVQIDSVPLNADYARANNTFWDVSTTP
jgi:MoaA/NifB/PqqE/SkfB family radical SAM enzyme